MSGLRSIPARRAGGSPFGWLRDPCAPSIDRLDNKKGYIVGNVWVVSCKANRLKSNATLKELTKLTRNWEQHAKRAT